MTPPRSGGDATVSDKQRANGPDTDHRTMTVPEKPDSGSDSESTPTTHLRAKVRLYVDHAAIPTVGELDGVKLVVETTSGGRLVKLVALLLAALALAYWSGTTPW